MDMDNLYRNTGNPDSEFEGQHPQPWQAAGDDPNDEATPKDDDDLDIDEDEDDDDFEDGDDDDAEGDEEETEETGETEPE